jgi:hypothetical protein
MRVARLLCAFAVVAGSGPVAGGDEPPAAGAVEFRALLGDLVEDAEELAFPESPAAPTNDLTEEVRALLRRGRLETPRDLERGADVVRRLRERRERGRTDRLGERVSSNLALDPLLGNYVRSERWRSPFLVVYAGGERLEPADYWERDAAGRAELRADVAARRDAWQPRVDAWAELVSGVYADFLGWFRDALDLRPLDDAWGGAPDLPEGVRSFHDGVPVVLWIAGPGRHDPIVDSILSAREQGRSHGRSGVGFVSDSGAREDLDHDVAVEATRQFLFRFRRQRTRWHWPSPHLTSSALWLGAAEWIASAKTGGALRRWKASGGDLGAGRGIPLPPIARVGGASRSADVRKAAPLDIFQAWAFLVFLDEHDGGRRRGALTEVLRGLLLEDDVARIVEVAPGIRTDEAAAAFDAEFAAFVRDDLSKRP